MSDGLHTVVKKQCRSHYRYESLIYKACRVSLCIL